MSNPNLDDPLEEWTATSELDDMEGKIAKRMMSYKLGSITIRTEVDYDRAHAFRQLLQSFVDGCKAVHDEYQADLEAALARGKARYTKRVGAKLLIDVEFKKEMGRFQTEKHNVRQDRIERVTEAFEAEQAEEQALEIERLQVAIGKAKNEVSGSVDRGQWEDEVEELQTALDEVCTMPPDVLNIPREAIPGTILSRDYDLLDVSLLKPEYTTLKHNHALIKAQVKAHGKKAEQIVGDGAILYKEEIIPKRDARRKQ